MANKIGVLETHQAPTEKPSFFIKRRVSDQLVSSGFARRISRWLIQMLSLKMRHALEALMCDSGELKAPRRPENLLLYYPIKDQSSYRHAQL